MVVNASIKKRRKISNQQPNLHVKGLEKRKTKFRRWKEMIKTIVEINRKNKVNRKKKLTKSWHFKGSTNIQHYT